MPSTRAVADSPYYVGLADTLPVEQYVDYDLWTGQSDTPEHEGPTHVAMGVLAAWLPARSRP